MYDRAELYAGPRRRRSVAPESRLAPTHAGLFPAVTILLLAWGAFAFGSEYAWAYAPLLVLSLVVGGLGALEAPTRCPPRALVIALGLIVCCVVLQLIPIPSRIVQSVSPASLTSEFSELWAKATMQDGTLVTSGDARELSIAPSRTTLGLAFLGAFVLLFIGCTRGMSAGRATTIARAVVVIGLIAAALEMAQRASGSDLAYGFWYRPFKGARHVPFINRNHTAGWLIMALSLSLGYLVALSAHNLRGVRPEWRHRVRWLSTPRASRVVLVALSTVVMAVGVVATTSRSGVPCLVFAITAMSAWVAWRYRIGSHRVLTASLVGIVLGVMALSAPLDVLLRRFETVSEDASLRVRIWQDALGIVRDFPVTGTGLNTFGIAMLRYQTIEDGSRYIEAHNDYLQLAAEGGLLLGAPILVSIGLFAREVRRRFQEGADDTMTYWVRAGAVIGICAIALQEAVEFTLQMPGAAALFVVLAATAIHRPDPGARGLAGAADSRSVDARLEA